MSLKKAFPVLFCFFVMGIVDLVGISTNYVKQDFMLSDTVANLLPLSLFVWFAVLAVPTGVIMNLLGRKRTVLISMVITFAAMVIPLIRYSFPVMLFAFGLLGIGNTLIQVALNPLVTNVVSGERLTSSLTLGQFIKAIAAFLGPVIAVRSALWFGDWKLVFLVYGAVTIVSAMWLQLTPIREETGTRQHSLSLKSTFGLLRDKTILAFFIGIIFLVGIDVGMNTTVPKFLMEKCLTPLEQAGLGTSLYFIARTIGTFLGAIILVSFPAKRFFLISMVIVIPAMIVMLFMTSTWSILAMTFIIGLAIANIFSIIFSYALKRRPEMANEVSGLLIMGIAGGAIVLPVMGVVADLFGQFGAMFVLLLLMVYLLYLAINLKDEKHRHSA